MEKKIQEIGIVKGEICNRDGCVGVIDEHEKDGSCSCHIHPPCSYCVTDTAYCPVCDWSCDDDVPPPIDPEIEKKNREYYKRQNEEFAAARELFYKRYSGRVPIEKLEMRIESHTHFSQKVIGVFPPGTETRESLYDQVKGTFGGRWTHFGKYNFEYIAYTD